MISIAGSGNYKGEELKSTNTKVEIAGSGNVTTHATNKLDASIAGSGSITYAGDPSSVEKDVAGSGSIKKK